MPKDSTKGQLLAAAGANETPYEEIPLREEERLAPEGDAHLWKFSARSPQCIDMLRFSLVELIYVDSEVLPGSGGL